MTVAAPAPTLPKAAALSVALVQFLLVSAWTTYAIYLPQLLQSAGLPLRYVPLLLLLDQGVFALTDLACGVAADRSLRTVGRVGPWVAGLTLLSSGAFLLLPHVARPGPVGVALLFGLTVVWTATSAALRAPAFALLGKHAARPALPRANTLALLGLAAGSALAPWLGLSLRQVDPRWPFALASLALVAATGGLVWVERVLAARPGVAPAPTGRPQVGSARHVRWLLAVLVLALGLQVHVALNAAPLFLRLAPEGRLEGLLPLFWAGFAFGMVPAAPLCQRLGAWRVMVGGALAGAVAAWGAQQAASLPWLVAAQIVAGLAWGHVMVGAFTSAPDFGRSGREGLALGGLFALLALATLARIGATLAGLAGRPGAIELLVLVPVMSGLLGAALIVTTRPRAP